VVTQWNTWLLLVAEVVVEDMAVVVVLVACDQAVYL
jgi:hypothetical protein